MKDYWILINKNNGHSITYDQKSFMKLKINCKQLLSLNRDSIYSIEYWKDNELEETVKMSDYF